MSLTKQVEILKNGGFSEAEIVKMTGEGARNALLRLGYDETGEPLPKSEIKTTEELANEQTDKMLKVLEKASSPLMLVEAIETDEYTLSGSAENTLNLGNYSSAKRGVFVGRKLRVPRDLPETERLEMLRTETKKLQFLAEAQLAGICAEAMGPNGFNDTSWFTVVSKVFKSAMARTKEVFGIIEPKA